MRTLPPVSALLILFVVAPLALGPAAMAQDNVQSKSSATPPVAATPPREPEGVGAAEALNADINARNAEAAARDRAAEEEYARKQREYEAKKKADAAAYARALADYDARKAALERKRQADLAAWQAQVAACKGGDKSACAPK